jgi:hypothetical protein
MLKKFLALNDCLEPVYLTKEYYAEIDPLQLTHYKLDIPNLEISIVAYRIETSNDNVRCLGQINTVIRSFLGKGDSS